MALVVVNLTDTFNEWREKDNQTTAQVGDLSSLATTNQTSIVDALNESMQNVLEDLTPQLGGPLDVNDKAIVTAVGTNKNVIITPDGTGDIGLETDKVKVGSSGEDATITTNGSGSLTIAPNDGGAGNPGIILENAGRILLNCVSGQPVIIDGDVTATSYTGDLTGTINTATTAATQLQSDNSTKVATTAWAKAYADAIILTEDTLEEMNDTVMSGKANLDILQFNGTNWINRTMTAAGIPTTGFTVAMAVALG